MIGNRIESTTINVIVDGFDSIRFDSIRFDASKEWDGFFVIDLHPPRLSLLLLLFLSSNHVVVAVVVSTHAAAAAAAAVVVVVSTHACRFCCGVFC